MDFTFAKIDISINKYNINLDPKSDTIWILYNRNLIENEQAM